MAQIQTGNREPTVGDDLGGYRLVALAGEGAMGRVYRAVHRKLGRTVALKLLRRKYASNADVLQRFFQEARAVNVIRHPNIVEITDFFEAPSGGNSYYIMEWLEGETLEARLAKEHVLPVDDVVTIGRQVAAGLAAAHRAGFIHRDLKPENIYLLEPSARATLGAPRFKVKVLDFGVALLQGAEDGAVAGTPVYMSPECAAGRAVDGRSDIYSLGVVLYQLCSGAPPFAADSLSGYVMQHMTARPRPLSDVVPSPIPAPLADAVDRCLEKKPESRFASMEDLESALAVLQARLALPIDRLRRWMVAGGGALVVAAALTVGIAVGAGHSPAGKGTATAGTTTPVTVPRTAVPVADPRIAVAIASLPSGAEVFHEGAVMGVTPCAIRLPLGLNTLEIRLEGFRPTVRTVEVEPGAALSVKLQPLPAPAKQAPKPLPSRGGTINPFE